MGTINVSVNVPSFDHLTDKQIIDQSVNMQRTVQDLITFIYYSGGQKLAELANLFITTQDHVNDFVTNYWQGDYDEIAADVEEYIASCYAA